MAVKVMQRRELTFWETLYLPQILSGLKITSAHLVRNLFLHSAHSLGLLKHVRASVTFQYPEEPRPLAARFRSRHRLTVREEGTPRCVGCMLCETVCPAKCINSSTRRALRGLRGRHNEVLMDSLCVAWLLRETWLYQVRLHGCSP